MSQMSLSELLKRSEAEDFDFKGSPYDFSSVTEEAKYKKGKFVKDVLAMANTPREGPAIILIGATPKKDGSVDAPGVVNHNDDNDFQQIIEANIHPMPRCRYEQHVHEGKSFGLFVIDADRTSGPFVAKVDFDGAGVRRNVLYIRHGSKNSEATHEEQKKIHQWFGGRQSFTIPENLGSDEWKKFLDCADPRVVGRHYVLVLAPIYESSPELLQHLGLVDWNMVIDLDPASDVGGPLKHAGSELGNRRAIHKVTKGDEIQGDLNRSTAWYLARGIEGRADTLQHSNFATWNKAYGADLRKKLSYLAASSPNPVVVVALSAAGGYEKHLQKVMSTCGELLGDRLVSVVVTECSESAKSLAEETDATVCEFDIQHFLKGISSLESNAVAVSRNAILMPGPSGTLRQISPEDHAWLEEDLELVHLSAGNRWAMEVDPETEFLKGAPISWFALAVGADVEREKLGPITKAVSRDLREGRITRINILHRAGTGGTTLARRLVWNNHGEFPCVLIRRCVPKETIERIAKLYSICEKPILLLREGSVVADNEADQLADFLKSRHIRSVILQVVRRYTESAEGERTFFLPEKLSNTESEWFRTKMSKAVPNRKLAIANVAKNSEARSPFIFALAAFEAEFAGLKPFVSTHLEGVPPQQKKILLYLAIAHAYGQQSVAEQCFAEILGIPAEKSVLFEEVLSPYTLGLIVQESRGYWRTAHVLVARELIAQVLSVGLSDSRNWNHRLADAACEFSDFCCSPFPVQIEEMEALVERVFYYRDDLDVLGDVRSGENQFSELINELPSPEARLRVLEHIVELFPEAPHCWAHLGRFLSIRLREFDRAIHAIDKAIALSPQDNVLYHIRGMALRSSVYTGFELGEKLSDLMPKIREASHAFEEARKLAPDDEHGYISEAQMIIRVLDRAKKAANTDATSVVTNIEADPWLREAFQKVEDLLLMVRQRRGADSPSRYEELCRADLDLLYGSHETALQRWQNLLDRRDGAGHPVAYAPPIRRQIVWTLLARANRRWDKLKQGQISRAVELLSLNLDEEPADDRNVRLWIQGARFLSPPPSLDSCIERIAIWRGNGDSLDAVYYACVLHILQALDGSPLAGSRAARALEECKLRSRYRRDRTRSFEWFGNGEGLNRLVHQDLLGEWNRDADFWENTSHLNRIAGIVVNISGQQAGEIELLGGIRAFFVPGNSGLVKGRDENKRVTFFLGFSYDGPRAWAVTINT